MQCQAPDVWNNKIKCLEVLKNGKGFRTMHIFNIHYELVCHKQFWRVMLCIWKKKYNLNLKINIMQWNAVNEPKYVMCW